MTDSQRAPLNWPRLTASNPLFYTTIRSPQGSGSQIGILSLARRRGILGCHRLSGGLQLAICTAGEVGGTFTVALPFASAKSQGSPIPTMWLWPLRPDAWCKPANLFLPNFQRKRFKLKQIGRIKSVYLVQSLHVAQPTKYNNTQGARV